MPIDLRQPFRGSEAVAAGLVTPGVLRGPRFRRLFTGIYVRADAEITFEVRSRAAYLLLDGRGALGGFSAAELLGASCGPVDAPAEIVTPRGLMTRRGLLVRHDELALDEVTEGGGCTVTSPLRTAYDLARRPPLVEAVVGLDALAFAKEIVPADVLLLARRHLGSPGERAAAGGGRARGVAHGDAHPARAALRRAPAARAPVPGRPVPPRHGLPGADGGRRVRRP
jgi:hypothetical protein